MTFGTLRILRRYEPLEKRHQRKSKNSRGTRFPLVISYSRPLRTCFPPRVARSRFTDIKSRWVNKIESEKFSQTISMNWAGELRTFIAPFCDFPSHVSSCPSFIFIHFKVEITLTIREDVSENSLYHYNLCHYTRVFIRGPPILFYFYYSDLSLDKMNFIKNLLILWLHDFEQQRRMMNMVGLIWRNV